MQPSASAGRRRTRLRNAADATTAPTAAGIATTSRAYCTSSCMRHSFGFAASPSRAMTILTSLPRAPFGASIPHFIP